MTNVPWTDERIEFVRVRWFEGQSSSMIAMALSDLEPGQPRVTRNGVIGVIYRKKWKRPELPAKVKVKKVRVWLGPRERRKKVALPPNIVVVSPPDPARFIDKRRDQCSWPIDDPNEPGHMHMLCCGAAREDGSAYCRTHKKAAGSSPTREVRPAYEATVIRSAG